MAKAKANYTEPNSKVDLEERLAKGNKSDLELSTYSDEAPEEDEGARKFALEDNDLDGYIGVDPVYQNYASDSLKPGRAEDGPEADLEAIAYGEVEPPPAPEPKEEPKDEPKDEKKDESASAATPASTPTAPAPATPSTTDNK